jgi:hypothetical protein
MELAVPRHHLQRAVASLLLFTLTSALVPGPAYAGRNAGASRGVGATAGRGDDSGVALASLTDGHAAGMHSVGSFPDEPPIADLPPDEDGNRRGPFEFEDLSDTPRPSKFTRMIIDPNNPARIFVTTSSGFIYRTSDAGQTWEETRVLPEQRRLYRTPGQRIFLGQIVQVRRNESLLPFNMASVQGPANLGQNAGADGARAAQALSRGLYTLSLGGGRGMGDDANQLGLGIGLSARAPRLNFLVSKFKERRGPGFLQIVPSQINLPRMLEERGSRRIPVNFVKLHAYEPHTVYAMTEDGLYLSTDDGESFTRVFSGVNNLERAMSDIKWDKKNPKHAILLTGKGVYESEDGGINWRKSTEQAADAGGSQILIDPQDSRFVYLACNNGVIRSTDSGRHWNWAYYTTYPPAGNVQWIDVYRQDPRIAYIGTVDGMFKTTDLRGGNLESWTRFGGLDFTSIQVIKVAACWKHPGHVYAMLRNELNRITNAYNLLEQQSLLLETWNDGATWKIIFTARSMSDLKWFELLPDDPDLLFVVSTRTLNRMHRAAPAQLREVVKEMAQQDPIGGNARWVDEVTGHYPSMTEVVAAVRQVAGIEVGTQMNLRKRAWYRSFVPNIRLAFVSWDPSASMRLSDLAYGGLDRTLLQASGRINQFVALASWNLPDTVLNFDALLFGRIERAQDGVRDDVTWSVHRYFSELQQIRANFRLGLINDTRSVLMARIRLECIDSALDMMSQGFLSEWRRTKKSPVLYEVNMASTTR